MNVRRDKSCIFNGWNSRPATVVPAGSNRSGDGGNKIVGAFDVQGRLGGSASRQAVTRVNAEQASKRLMRESTQRSFGEDRRRGEERERHTSTVPPGYWRRHACTRRWHETREAPAATARDRQPDSREGQDGPSGVTERFVVAWKPGNSGGAKGPQFKDNARRSEG